MKKIILTGFLLVAFMLISPHVMKATGPTDKDVGTTFQDFDQVVMQIPVMVSQISPDYMVTEQQVQMFVDFRVVKSFTMVNSGIIVQSKNSLVLCKIQKNQLSVDMFKGLLYQKSYRTEGLFRLDIGEIINSSIICSPYYNMKDFNLTKMDILKGRYRLDIGEMYSRHENLKSKRES